MDEAGGQSMPNEYPFEVRRKARLMWLSGRYSDLQIAAELKIPRADTIRDWRQEEGWGALARDIAQVIQTETKAGITKQQGEFRSKYDQLGKVLESRAIQALSNPSVAPRDLRAIASTLALTQRIRERALGAEGESGANDLADVLKEARERRERKRNGADFGRCRSPSAGDGDDASPAIGTPGAQGPVSAAP